MDDYARIEDQGCHKFLDLLPNEKGKHPQLEIKEEASASHELDESLELRLGPPVTKRETSQPRHVRVPPSDMHGRENNKQGRPSPSVRERTAPSYTLVGWPPVRTSRKNLASGGSSSGLRPESGIAGGPVGDRKLLEEPAKKTLVKIYMDGIPIGRKVDLKACGSYEKLSHAVDKLFRWLIAAQAGGTTACDYENKAFRGLLDGSGEYALVYEDNEGDKMVVGDVPWKMFVPTVKRLRVMKRSEISTLMRGKRKALS